MRIIAGRYRGKRIDPPPGFKSRPTTDYARESLFNILSNRIDFESCEVLDLFSGTGSISYEFVSRGVKSIHLVERDQASVSFIRRTMAGLKAAESRIIHIDVKAYLKACRHKYDIVFADPPFDLPWLADLPDLVLGADILKEEGFFILEHPKRISFGAHRYFSEHRDYGSVNFTFFKILPGQKLVEE